MSALDSLIEMGFPQNRAEKALAVTGNQGAPAAMEWLLAHSDDADIDQPHVAPQGRRLCDDAPSSPASEPGNTEAAAADVAASLKCDECGKQLRDASAAQAHATRTGHSQFSESVEEVKPLTDEEKAAQKARLLQTMQEKRKLRQEAEKQNEIEKEKIRRKSGKEVVDAKEKFESQKRLLDAEQRKREMLEAKKAKDEVMAKVAADKAERAAARQQGSAAASAAPTTGQNRAGATASSVGDAPPVKKQYSETKVRVRLPDGRAVVNTFQASDTFAAIYSFVGKQVTTQFVVKCPHPPKTFGSADMNVDLKSLGLVPSATLTVIAQQGQR